jgi:hypothetical protein
VGVSPGEAYLLLASSGIWVLDMRATAECVYRPFPAVHLPRVVDGAGRTVKPYLNCRASGAHLFGGAL